MGAPSRPHLVNRWSGTTKVNGVKVETHYWSCRKCNESGSRESKHARDVDMQKHMEKR